MDLNGFDHVTRTKNDEHTGKVAVKNKFDAGGWLVVRLGFICQEKAMFDSSGPQPLKEIVMYETEINHCSKRKVGKPMGPDAPHYPNKAERKELARICQASGLTEDEIRQNKDHRISLAKSQNSMHNRIGNRSERFELLLKREKREIAKRLNVPVWHEDVTKALNLPYCEWRSTLTVIQALKRKVGIWY
jgi:hypothetical protein